MLLHEIKDVVDGRCITLDGGPGSGVEGHKTSEQVETGRQTTQQRKIAFYENQLKQLEGLRKQADAKGNSVEVDKISGVIRHRKELLWILRSAQGQKEDEERSRKLKPGSKSRIKKGIK